MAPKHADTLTYHCPGYREGLSSGSWPNLNIFASPQPPSGSPQHTSARARQSAPKSATRRHRLRQQPQQSCGNLASPSQSWSRRKVAARGRTCTSAVHDTNSPESEHLQRTSGDESVSARSHRLSGHEYCRADQAVGSVCSRHGRVCTGQRGEAILSRRRRYCAKCKFERL